MNNKKMKMKINCPLFLTTPTPPKVNRQFICLNIFFLGGMVARLSVDGRQNASVHNVVNTPIQEEPQLSTG